MRRLQDDLLVVVVPTSCCGYWYMRDKMLFFAIEGRPATPSAQLFTPGCVVTSTSLDLQVRPALSYRRGRSESQKFGDRIHASAPKIELALFTARQYDLLLAGPTYTQTTLLSISPSCLVPKISSRPTSSTTMSNPANTPHPLESRTFKRL